MHVCSAAPVASPRTPLATRETPHAAAHNAEDSTADGIRAGDSTAAGGCIAMCHDQL